MSDPIYFADAIKEFFNELSGSPVIDPLAPVLPVADEGDLALAAADAPPLPIAYGRRDLVLLPAGHVVEREHLAAQVCGQGALIEVCGIEPQPLYDAEQALARLGLRRIAVNEYLHRCTPYLCTRPFKVW